MGVIEGVRTAFPTKSPNAQIFEVDPSISGSLQDAIDNAVSGNGDIILVKRGGHTVTQAVNFNKSGIRVIAVDDGLSPIARGEFNGILADGAYTDGPVAQITAPCYIQGMGFVSRDTGATFFSGAACLIGGAAPNGAYGVHMKHCRFPKWALDNRIGLAIAGGAAVSDVLIEECVFEGGGADFDSGIYVQGAIQNLEIRRCRFRDCTYAITHGAFAGGGGPHCMYIENVCEDSKLLDSGGNTADGLICGNYLETATNASSYDATTATLNGQGLNFSGNHYAE